MEQPTATNETDSLAEWSAADRAWLDGQVPGQIRHLAVKHGRLLTQWVLNAGNSSYALGVLSRQTRGNQAAGKAIAVTQGILNGFLTDLVTLHFGQDGVKQFMTIKAEFDIALALQDIGQQKEGDRVSKGGIILDS